MITIRAMRGHLTNPRLMATCAVGFNILFNLVGGFTYVNFYLADQPFSLSASALALFFSVYLIGAVMTPLSGRIIDRIGFKRTLTLAVTLSVCGLLLSLVQSLTVVVLGMAMQATGLFACQSASFGHIGKSAHEAKPAAAGLYVTFYYIGGFVGTLLPGYLWAHGGWIACVVMLIGMQLISLCIVKKLWSD
jgi:MFS transporter, YNFM family, putative membrane transport protein